jgi:hypothetical protein
MQVLVIASIGAMSLGAWATCLIAGFISDEVGLKGSLGGRYAHLGEDDVKEIPRPTRRNRRPSPPRPDVAGRVSGCVSRRPLRRQARSCVRDVNPR